MAAAASTATILAFLSHPVACGRGRGPAAVGWRRCSGGRPGAASEDRGGLAVAGLVLAAAVGLTLADAAKARSASIRWSRRRRARWP
jgi:hypothetical protein